jgi:hypothetical protein
MFQFPGKPWQDFPALPKRIHEGKSEFSDRQPSMKLIAPAILWSIPGLVYQPQPEAADEALFVPLHIFASF